MNSKLKRAGNGGKPQQFTQILHLLKSLTTCPNIMFEKSACQKSNCLLDFIFYNPLMKR